jgi:transposase
MPPSLRDWLPADDLVWFVIDAVGQMDLSAFRAKCRADGWGASAFPPEMMVTLLLYAYCTGQRSSRKIEKLCERDVAFRIVAGNTKPDHATIARFRRNDLKELEGLFVQILRLCAEAGLVKVGVVALDGTKIAANRTHEGLEKEIAKEVARMLAEAESTDAAEDRRHGSKRGDEMPEELRTQKSRIERLRECKERLEREAAERAAEQQRKIDERAAKEAETGEKLRGRKPKEPDPDPPPEAKANVTDPETRIMKTQRGYVQGINAQAAATQGQIILAAEVTQEANDERDGRRGAVRHDEGPQAAQGALGRAAAERPDTGRHLADGAHGPEAPDETRARALQATIADDRTGVRADQGRARHRPIPPERAGRGLGRVEAGLRDAQPAQAVAQRPGGVELKAAGRSGRESPSPRDVPSR